jgi:uncharacterized membrane protein
MTQLHYLPLSLLFFSALVGLYVILFILVQIGILRHVYMRLGISPRFAFLLLMLSLIGSYLNIAVAELPERQIVAGQIINFFGMNYVVPVVTNWPGTVITVNVGGAVIPTLMSFYLLIKNKLWGLGLVGTIGVAVVCHLLAHPVPGLGIAVPVFGPTIAAVIVALSLSRQQAAPLAYVSGSLGTLIGADLLNRDKLQGLGARSVDRRHRYVHLMEFS